MKTQKTETIDITPKWQNLVSMYFQWIENGLESQREFAISELTRLAKIADKLMSHRKHKLTCDCGEEFNLS